MMLLLKPPSLGTMADGAGADGVTTTTRTTTTTTIQGGDATKTVDIGGGDARG